MYQSDEIQDQIYENGMFGGFLVSKDIIHLSILQLPFYFASMMTACWTLLYKPLGSLSGAQGKR